MYVIDYTHFYGFGWFIFNSMLRKIDSASLTMCNYPLKLGSTGRLGFVSVTRAEGLNGISSNERVKSN